MQSLAAILASCSSQNSHYRFAIDDDWSQGRTVFGGLVTALATFSLRQQVPADRPLRALQVVFIGPNAPGHIDFEPRIDRQGKAATLATCTVRCGGEITATISAMFGTARASALKIEPASEAIGVLPHQVTDIPRDGGIPAFTQHYHMRWARGGLPFTKAADSRMSVYLRYRDEEPVARLSEPHALALMDVIPSPALAMLATPGPASTSSWTLELLDHQFDFAVDKWWRLDAHVDAAIDGYVMHTSHVINPNGRVVAISRQVVVIYG